MPGPPKKPTALKLLEGTFREDRVAKGEPKPKGAIPKPPKRLKGAALEEWGRITVELYELGLLTNLDRAALVIYCEFWADYETAREKVERTGLTIATQAGNTIENPAYSIMKRSAEIMHKFLVEFGMTPASRTRISTTPLGKQNQKDGNEEEEKYFG